MMMRNNRFWLSFGNMKLVPNPAHQKCPTFYLFCIETSSPIEIPDKQYDVSNDKPWWNTMKDMGFLVIPKLLTSSPQEYNSLIQATTGADLKVQTFHKNLSLVQNGIQTLSFQVGKDGSLSFVMKCTPGEYIKPLQPALDSKMFAVLGWSGDAATSSIEVYDSKSRKWSYFAQNAYLSRAYHSVVVLSGLIYIIGGFDGRYCYDSTYCFNIRTRKWSRRENMHKSRCYVTAVAHRGLIYAMGGHDGIYRFRSCEKYDPKLREWQFFASMHHRRSDASSAAHKGLIFICGGFDGDIVLDSAEIYDPSSDQWKLIAPMLSPRSGLSLVSHNERILALGGFDGYDRLSTVEEFDENENCWTASSPMLTTRSNFAAAVFEGEIYAIGGYNAKSFNFAFQHHESIAISDTDDDLQEEDYDEPGMVEDKENEENKHVRKRRSVKWAPDYDLYEQWAEEYYSQYESPDENPKAILNKPETLLDKIIGHNKTEEELESERLAAAEKKEFILRSFQVFTWIFGGLIIYCCIRNLIRKILDKICCDFCSVFSFKKKITKLVNNFVPGVYIHKNGKKEFYVPTEEELEALKEIQKLLYSVV